MGKMSKEKGKRGEREVAELLRGNGWHARRGQQFAGGTDSPDVVSTLPDVHIEVKRSESIQVYKALEQATNDAKANEMPTVWHKKNGQDWVVILTANDFLRLMEKVASI
jgi:Holliday junction resolvase